jgi:pyridoxamine 5'-phosphate oxidase
MSPSPFLKFTEMLRQEGFDVKDGDITPNLSAVLSTSSREGGPSSRTIYIKKFADEGLFFFTNENSKKGRQIAQNPLVSLCFLFEISFKQIIVEGEAIKTEHKLAQDYFNTRSSVSRAGAILSHQSSPLDDYAKFVEEAKILAESSNLKCPNNWQCYKVVPSLFEFWHGNTHRLHLREQFVKSASNEWQGVNLYP